MKVLSISRAKSSSSAIRAITPSSASVSPSDIAVARLLVPGHVRDELLAVAAEPLEGVGELPRLGERQVLAGPAAGGPGERRAAGDRLGDLQLLLAVVAAEPEAAQD